ncbi:hypothetical protein [uncultured Methanobrevibacter sp.]|nr:hypothetical protein [uncultured Methanobrevibacter sp.]
MIESILSDFYCILEKETTSDFTSSIKDLIESDELTEENLSELIIKEACK